MDNDPLYLALSEKELYDCIRPTIKQEWNSLRNGDCTDEFSADSTTNFSSRTCCAKHKKHDGREPGLFKEEFRGTEMICLCSKTYCCFDSESNKFNFSSKGLDKTTLEVCGDGLMSKHPKVLERFVEVTSTNESFCAIQHAVATYVQTRKGLSSFYPKGIVQKDGKHNRRPNIQKWAV